MTTGSAEDDQSSAAARAPAIGARALVIGVGSIGERHRRVLAGLGVAVATVSRRPGAGDFTDIATAIATHAPALAVVAVETAAHGDAVTALLAAGHRGPILVEKPLWLAPRPLPAELLPGQLVVGYNLRFHPLLRRLREELATCRLFTAEIRCASWLPGWRAGRDYKETASARAGAGGGVLRDLSHELDYGRWLLGDLAVDAARVLRSSDLAIAADDTALLLCRSPRCPAVTIALNYLDQPTERRVIVNTDRGCFRLDLVAGSLARDGVSIASWQPASGDDTYIAMHRSLLAGAADTLCTAEEGAAVMAMIAAAEALAGWQPG